MQKITTAILKVFSRDDRTGMRFGIQRGVSVLINLRRESVRLRSIPNVIQKRAIFIINIVYACRLRYSVQCLSLIELVVVQTILFVFKVGFDRL